MITPFVPLIGVQVKNVALNRKTFSSAKTVRLYYSNKNNSLLIGYSRLELGADSDKTSRIPSSLSRKVVDERANYEPFLRVYEQQSNRPYALRHVRLPK